MVSDNSFNSHDSPSQPVLVQLLFFLGEVFQVKEGLRLELQEILQFSSAAPVSVLE